MKKTSRSLSLVLMGSLTVAAGGCASDEQTEEYRAYNSVDECVREAVFSPRECGDMAVAAAGQSPAYASLAECEAEFGAGNCGAKEGVSQSGTGHSSWMPLISGYMMGRYLGGGGMMQSAQPLYNQQGQTQSGAAGRSFRTLGGDLVRPDAAGKVANPSQAVRGGFARSAKPYAVRSGGGSRGGFSGGMSSS